MELVDFLAFLFVSQLSYMALGFGFGVGLGLSGGFLLWRATK